MLTKFLGISGPKKAGKTTTIEALTPKLLASGLKVGTVKIAFKDVTIDVNQEHYDVVRLRKAHPTKTLFKSRIDTTVFYNEELSLREALLEFGRGLDIVLIEGFKEDLIGIPQIVLLKEEGQEADFVDGFTVAVSSIPEFSIRSNHENFVVFEKLAELVEESALPVFPSLDCKHCGFDTCNQLIQEIVAGRKQVNDCYVLELEGAELLLKVNNKNIPCNPFVRTLFRNTILALVKSIRLEEKDPREIDLKLLIRKEELEEDKP